MRWRIPIAAACALLALYVYLQNRANQESLLITHPGYTVYREHCRRCHGAWGNAKRASRMAGHPVDLGSAVYRDTTAVDSIMAVIAHGKGRMKGYATQLRPPDLDAVTSYVLELPDARRERESRKP